MDETTVAVIVLVGVSAVVLFVWAVIRWHARLSAEQRRGVAWLFVGAAFTMPIWGVLLIGRVERVTLHEVILDGTPGGVLAEPLVHVVPFDVVHAGVEHTIEIVPQYRPPLHWSLRPGFPIVLSYELRAPGGGLLARAQRTLLKPDSRALSWDDERVQFVPAAAGRYELELQLKSPGVPSVRVRVVDPLYKEGRRVEGF